MPPRSAPEQWRWQQTKPNFGASFVASTRCLPASSKPAKSLHQFVRSLEALILPDVGKTRKQFTHRCQTFARADKETRLVLQEAFDMRSDTEHLHEWDEAVQNHPANRREDVCWHRTRQIEQLACDAYSRLLRDTTLRKYFRTDATIAAFWRLPDDERCSIWGNPLDITQEPFVQKYDGWGRAMM